MRSLLFALLIFPTLAAAAPETPPFWKAKPKIYERIQNREIIVAVTSAEDSSKSPRHHLKVEGGGQVRAPLSFLFEHAQHYHELSRSTYVKQSDYDPKTHILKLKIEAFGHSEAMQLKMDAKKDPKDRILFTVLTGGLKGMSGELVFSSVSPEKSEVGIHADYRYDQFPIPKLFLEFGMEVVFQKMAAHLRGFVEDQYEKSKGNG